MEEVPDDWWREACHVVNHPMACVAPSNKFVWVNQAFERLVGYSRSELREKTWMEITIQSDVGGDLASVNAVLDGTDTQYTMAKRYRHKHGQDIPVELTVWRFPRTSSKVFACFIVEAVPEKASKMELQELRDKLHEGIANLETRWRLMEEQQRKGVNVSYHSQNADRGGSNSNNSNAVIIAVAIMMGVMFVAAVALIASGSVKIGSDYGSIDVNGKQNQQRPQSTRNDHELAPANNR